MQRGRRSGLTLAELVVVLTILAIMAASASVFTTGAIEQARYDGTVKTLDAIKRAIVGNSEDYVGTPTGYIADNGGLPSDLSQLGAYLSLNSNFANLLDGWGHEIKLKQIPGGIRLVSFGADQTEDDPLVPSVGFNRDLVVNLLLSDWQSSDIRFMLREANAQPLASGTWQLYWTKASTGFGSEDNAELAEPNGGHSTDTYTKANVPVGTYQVYAKLGTRHTGKQFVTIYPRSKIYRELVLEPPPTTPTTPTTTP